MIPRSNHGAHTVHALGQPARNLRRQPALAITRVVDPLEKGELGRVRRGQSPQVANLLDRNVRVANDVPVLVEVLGCGVVTDARVDEVASAQVLGLDGHVEGRAGLQGVAGLRVQDDT